MVAIDYCNAVLIKNTIVKSAFSHYNNLIITTQTTYFTLMWQYVTESIVIAMLIIIITQRKSRWKRKEGVKQCPFCLCIGVGNLWKIVT